MVFSGESGFDMEVCEDECAVMHLCLEFWKREHHFKKCVLEQNILIDDRID